MSTQNLKLSARSPLSKLTVEQRQTVEEWLFDENLSYLETGQRCLSEFKIKITIKSLFSFYRLVAQKRTLDRITHSANNANAVVKTFTENPADTYQALIKVAGQIAFDKAIQSPDQLDLPTIRDFTRLLIASRHADLNSKKFHLDREKWEFDVARTCFNHHAELQALVANKSLDEDARLQAIRRSLFGENLPD